MSAADWVTIAVGIGGLIASILLGIQNNRLASHQNEIFREQNRIFAAQAGITMPETVTSVPNKIKLYWPAMVAVIVALGTGIIVARVQVSAPKAVGAIAVGLPWSIAILLVFATMYMRGRSNRSVPLSPANVSSPKPSRLKIIEAHYGVEGINNPDVTQYLLERLHGNSYAELVGPDLFHGLDPVGSNPNKKLTVRYSFDSKEAGIVRPEHEWLILPEDMFLRKLLDACQHSNVQLNQSVSSLLADRHHAEAERDELRDKLEGFTSLQMEALMLSKDILKFIEEMGKKPTLDKEDFGFNKKYNTFESAIHMQEFGEANSKVERPWTLKFASTWEADFKQRVDSIVPRLGKAGIDANGIRRINDDMNQFFVKNNAAFEIAKQLAYAALGLDTMRVVPILDEAPK